MGIFKIAGSNGSGNGSYKPRNSQDGADWERRVEVITQFFVAWSSGCPGDVYQVTGVILRDEESSCYGGNLRTKVQK